GRPQTRRKPSLRGKCFMRSIKQVSGRRSISKSAKRIRSNRRRLSRRARKQCGLTRAGSRRLFLVASPLLRRRREIKMSYGFLDVAVIPSARVMQAKMGADRIWKDFKEHRQFDCFTGNVAGFIADRDSFTWRRYRRRAGFMSSTEAATTASSD